MTHEKFLSFLNSTPWKCFKRPDPELCKELMNDTHLIDEKFNDGSWLNNKHRVWEMAVKHNNLELLKFLTEECASQWAGGEQWIADGYKSPMERPCALIGYSLYMQNRDPYDMFNWIGNPLVEYIITTVYADADPQKILNDFRRCDSEKQLEFFVNVDEEVYPIIQRKRLLAAVEDKGNDTGDRGKRRM